MAPVMGSGIWVTHYRRMVFRSTGHDQTLGYKQKGVLQLGGIDQKSGNPGEKLMALNCSLQYACHGTGWPHLAEPPSTRGRQIPGLAKGRPEGPFYCGGAIQVY